MADVDYAFIPKAQILASHAHANLDKDWGPFQSKDAALQSMPNTAVRKAGKKFGVVSTVGGVTTIEEYMFTKDNATDNDIVKLVLSSDDVTGTFDYTIGSTTSEQLSEAIGANKIITIGTYIASVGRVGTSSSGYYVVCYTDEDGVFHKIVHEASTSSVGTETTKEFAEVETINSISELGFSGVIGGIKKYQGNTMLDLGGVSESGTLGNVIKNLISLGVHIDADDTNNVFAIKNINNETIGSITLGTNATNGAAELTFVAGSNQFTATLPNLTYDSTNQMLKYIDAEGDDHDLIRLSNLQIKTVFDHITYGGNAPTSVDRNTYAIGDLALVEKQDTSTTPTTITYDLAVVQSVTAGTPNDTIQWQKIGSINNVSLQADQVSFTPNGGLSSTNVQSAIEEVNIIGNSNTYSDLDIADENGSVLARFEEGHIKTKNFDSRDVGKIKQNTGLSEYDEFDDTVAYAVGDIVIHDGLLYKFTSAHVAGVWNPNDVVQTSLSENAEHPVSVDSTTATCDLDIVDINGHVLVRFSGGHIKTKNFDSSKIQGAYKVLNGDVLDNEGNVIPVCTPLVNVKKKAELFRTIQWEAKSSIASTPNPSGDIEAGVKYGLPYTSCMEVDKFVGFEVSLRTFMTCANNPYSLLYTENLRAPGTSGYGFTYHGSRNTIGGYMGVVCSIFAFHSVGVNIPYATSNWEWMKKQGLLTRPLDQKASGVRIGDLIWESGHGRVITGVKKNTTTGEVLAVTYEESIMDFPITTTKSASDFNSFMLEKVHDKPRYIYRFPDIYKNYDFEPWKDDYVYNNDICTFAGDYACFRKGQIMFLNYNLVNVGSWTQILLYKDNELLGTYNLDADTSVHRYDLTNLNLNYGKYKARLTDGTNYSEYTYFEVVDANVSWSSENNVTRITFSSENGFPLYIRWCTIDGGPIGIYVLTEVDKDRGYADVNMQKLVSDQGGTYGAENTYIKVCFKGEYGCITSTPTLFMNRISS